MTCCVEAPVRVTALSYSVSKSTHVSRAGIKMAEPAAADDAQVPVGKMETALEPEGADAGNGGGAVDLGQSFKSVPDTDAPAAADANGGGLAGGALATNKPPPAGLSKPAAEAKRPELKGATITARDLDNPAKPSSILIANNKPIRAWNDSEYARIRDQLGVADNFLLNNLDWKSFKPGRCLSGGLLLRS